MPKTPSPPSARAKLATNIRNLREVRELSQEKLAAAAGLHRTYIGSVERGERNVSIDNVERIAIALGVSVAELVAGC